VFMMSRLLSCPERNIVSISSQSERLRLRNGGHVLLYDGKTLSRQLYAEVDIYWVLLRTISCNKLVEAVGKVSQK
jgi:hypothetical protein